MTYPPPYPHQPWPPHPLAPSKATAVTAAILALLLGALMALATVYLIIGLAGWSGDIGLPLAFTAGYGLITVVLLTGGSLLLARKRAGQILTIIGAGIVLALIVLSMTMHAFGGPTGLVGPALALPAIIFAAIPPTSAWLTTAPRPAPFPFHQGFPGPADYPPHPGFPGPASYPPHGGPAGYQPHGGFPAPGHPAQRPY
ncbi:hypothetical protein ACTG9Q_02960 [Actinokineospora sp. 24-640]